MSIIDLYPDLRDRLAQNCAGIACEKPALMVAMTARTGSTHLCAALASCMDVSRPDEVFNPRGVAQAVKWKRNVETFAALFSSFNAEPAGIFAFKTNWQDFAPFAPYHRQLFPNLRVVYLDRRDIIAQAVSLARAQLTDEWHIPKGSAAPRATAESIEGKFNPHHVAQLIKNLDAEKSDWTKFFARNALRPGRLFYEDFEHNIVPAINAISRGLGIPLTQAQPASPAFNKLADALNEDWIARTRRHVLRVT